MKHRTYKTLILLCLPLILWSQDADSVAADAESLEAVDSLADGPIDSAMDVLEAELENTPAEDSSGVAIQEDLATQGTDEIIQSEGFTFTGLARGVLGMSMLILLSVVFSSNRKAIRWRSVGIGLFAQLVLAVGVLKVTVVQSAFELVSKLFVKTLEFTEAGSTFLLGNMMNDAPSSPFGYIFLFQVLPTIIFFLSLIHI